MTIQISSPVAGASVSGTVNLVGTSGGVIIQAMDGTTPLGSAVLSAPLPFTIPVDTTKLTNGAQTLSVGDGTSTATVAVVVNNVVIPPVVLSSPDGSTIPALSQIVDAAGHVWTVPGGVVQRDGVAAGFTDQVTSLLYYQGTLWQENIASLWWPWDGTSWSGAGVADPRQVASPPPPTGPGAGPSSIYRGINYHIGQGEAIGAAQISLLTALGINMLRTDADTVGAAQLDAKAYPLLAAANIKVLATISAGLPSGATNETTAFTLGKTLGTNIATILKGKAYAYELCNELDPLAGGTDGDVNSQYVNTTYKKLRGWLCGLVAGIRTQDTVALIVAPAGSWKHVAWPEMLLSGKAPDGSTGGQLLTCDVISWHWYSDMGDITTTTLSTNGSVLSRLHALGKPIWISEYGAGNSAHPVPGTSGGTETQITNWLLSNGYTGGFPTIDAVAGTWNIQSVLYYDFMTDGTDGDYGVVQSDGVTKKARFAAMQEYFASAIQPARNSAGVIVT